MAEFGQFSLSLTLFITGYAIFADILGVSRQEGSLLKSGANALIACWLSLTAAVVVLTIALVQSDFSIAYVVENTSLALPLAYRLSALWAGASGSLLFWLWLQVGFAAWVFCRTHAQTRSFAAVARLACNVITLFFLVSIVFDKNPFELSLTTNLDGMGLNPLLQHPAMVLHPPLLFVGYAAYVIPFCWAFPSMVYGNQPSVSPYFKSTRNWMLWAWIFLSAGIVLGAWWAYEELGWGGYWAWDPVENASLMPWLIGTALLHCFNRYRPFSSQARWLTVLALLTFSLCVFGRFLTKYGLVSSVHTFQDRGLGILFIYLLVVIWVAALILLIRQIKQQSTQPRPAPLAGDNIKELTNWILVILTVVVFVGTLFPFLSGLVSDRQISLKPEYFTKITSLPGLLLVLVIGICPHLLKQRVNKKFRYVMAVITIILSVAFWFHTEALTIPCFIICGFVLLNLIADFFVKDPMVIQGQAEASVFRRPLRWYGARISHLGVALIFIGMAGSGGYEHDKQFSLQPGQAATLQDYEITFQSLTTDQTTDKIIRTAAIAVMKNNEPICQLSPAWVLHTLQEQTTTEVDIARSLGGDLYVALTSIDTKSDLIVLRVLIKPLINWLWIGSVVMVLGALMVLIAWYFKKQEFT